MLKKGVLIEGIALKISKVLVAVDGSANSERALDFAVDFADKYGADLTILNVSESPAVGAIPLDQAALSGDNMAVVAKDLQKAHTEILRKATSYAAQIKPGLVVSSKLREGNPASEIIAEAKEAGCDVIVIGHRGVGKVKELLGMGGISDKVAHLAPCPVVIVR